MESLLVLSLMAIVCGVLLWRPLLKSGVMASRSEHELEFYKDQLKEVERDQERGIIGPEEAEASRIEISRKIINCGDGVGSQAVWPKKKQFRFALCAAFLIPLASSLVYISQGSPGLKSNPVQTANRGQANIDEIPPEVKIEINKMRERLEKNPKDLETWVTLGRTYFRSHKFERAAQIYMQATTFFPENAELFARAGEALVFGSNGAVVPAAELAFKRSLQIVPKDARSRYYLALGAQQNGRLREALKQLSELAADSPPNAPWQDALKQRIASLSEQISEAAENSGPLNNGVQEAQTRTNTVIPGPSREDIAAAQELSSEDRQQMIRSMVERLASRLEENPSDLNGWRRLARARKVLGQKAEEKVALGKIASLLPKNVDAQLDYMTAMIDSAAPDMPRASELKPILGRILRRDDRNPAALWYSGLLAKEEGRKTEAAKHWSNLLSVSDPNSPRYVELKNEIKALKD